MPDLQEKPGKQVPAHIPASLWGPLLRKGSQDARSIGVSCSSSYRVSPTPILWGSPLYRVSLPAVTCPCIRVPVVQGCSSLHYIGLPAL